MRDAREPRNENNDLPVVCLYSLEQEDKPADQHTDPGKYLNVAHDQNGLEFSC